MRTQLFTTTLKATRKKKATAQEEGHEGHQDTTNTT